jgi:hypothetical protein
MSGPIEIDLQKKHGLLDCRVNWMIIRSIILLKWQYFIFLQDTNLIKFKLGQPDH